MDHDRLFKDLITNFFVKFIDLFFPQMSAELDPLTIEFLDKELFTDILAGGRHEDLLAKVKLSGSDVFILIHVENQATWQADFPKRMFRYFSVLHGKYDLPIFPIAIFSYDRPLTAAEDKYLIELFDLPVLRFQYRAIQLNRLNWWDFLSKPNPVASALMTKMNIAKEDRPRVQLECLRMLATLKLDPARTALIGSFMKSYLTLTAAEELVYNQQLQAIDPEQRKSVMEYTTEWQDRGRIEGRMNVIDRLLNRRFGAVPSELSSALRHLTIAQIDDFAEALLDSKPLPMPKHGSLKSTELSLTLRTT